MTRLHRSPFETEISSTRCRKSSQSTMALNESKSKNDMQDIKYVEEAEESVATETDADRVAEEKALVRKIDIALLPCIWIMYLLSYMDVRHPY
jgi:hypothetical protein